MTAPGFWQKFGRVIDETVADLRLRIAEVFDGPAIPHESDDLDPMAGRWSDQEPARKPDLPYDPEPTTATKPAEPLQAVRCPDCGGTFVPSLTEPGRVVCDDCGRARPGD